VSGKRGVTLLIKQELLHDHRSHLPESQGKVPRGTVVHVSLHVRNAQCSTHIIAVYIPPEDMEARNLIYDYVQQVAESLDRDARTERTHMIVMGDFNATAQPTGRQTTGINGQPQDRPSTTLTSDRAHRNFIAMLQHTLPTSRMTLSDSHPQEMTYQHTTEGLVHHSQIDDIILWSNRTPEQDAAPQAQAIMVPQIETDHKAVTVTVHQQQIHIPRKPRPPSVPYTKTKWNRSLLQDKDALRDLALEIELDTVHTLNPLTAQIGQIRHEHTLPTSAELDKLAEGLAIVLEQALTTCKRKAAKEIQVNDRPHPTLSVNILILI
jgi:endonuclease/exonuclease/phosphatase family metal-dependent hydrolase